MDEQLKAVEPRLKALSQQVAAAEGVPADLRQDFQDVVHALWCYCCSFEGKLRDLDRLRAEMEQL